MKKIVLVLCCILVFSSCLSACKAKADTAEGTLGDSDSVISFQTVKEYDDENMSFDFYYNKDMTIGQCFPLEDGIFISGENDGVLYIAKFSQDYSLLWYHEWSDYSFLGVCDMYERNGEIYLSVIGSNENDTLYDSLMNKDKAIWENVTYMTVLLKLSEDGDISWILGPEECDDDITQGRIYPVTDNILGVGESYEVQYYDIEKSKYCGCSTTEYTYESGWNYWSFDNCTYLNNINSGQICRLTGVNRTEEASSEEFNQANKENSAVSFVANGTDSSVLAINDQSYKMDYSDSDFVVQFANTNDSSLDDSKDCWGTATILETDEDGKVSYMAGFIHVTIKE